METSQLNRLPPELRNNIYQLTLASEGSRQIARGLAITQTCRQVRAESLLMYYANSDGFEAVVDVIGPYKVARWLKTRDSKILDNIKSLTITSRSTEFETFDNDSLRNEADWRQLCSMLTEKGFTPARVKVRVDSTKSSGVWIIRVRNHGDSLNKEVCQSILDRRFRNRFLHAWGQSF